MTGLVVAFAESSKSKTHEFGTSRSGSLRSGQGRSKHRHSAALTYAYPHGLSIRGYYWSTKGYLARFEIRDLKCELAAGKTLGTVSYTHLTLPTICSV